jgi:hypothetical protein
MSLPPDRRKPNSQKEEAMPKKPPNAGKAWTPKQEAQLRREATGNIPTRVIALHLKRTESSVRSKAQEMGVSVKPTNQSPYGTGGKRRSR